MLRCSIATGAGERGIRIFAPCPFKRTVTGDDGEPETVQGIFFKVVCVFDIAQTDGQALPDVDVPDVHTAADTLLAALERVATQRGIAVNYADLRAGHYGTSAGGTIDLANGHTTGQQARWRIRSRSLSQTPILCLCLTSLSLWVAGELMGMPVFLIDAASNSLLQPGKI